MPRENVCHGRWPCSTSWIQPWLGCRTSYINKLIKGTISYFDVKLERKKWYEMSILILGETMTAFIDGEKIGSLTSPGIGHVPKQNLAFAVSGRADVDDLRIRKFK